MNDLQLQRTEQINNLISELNGMLKMSVDKAVEVGKLLSEQKEELNHGEFLPWLESSFDMSQKTAYRYMNLNVNKNKIVNVTNLQEAYQQIETIEKQQKKEQEQEDNKLIFKYNQTGVKPYGWERRHDYLYKKQLDNTEFQKRKNEAFEKRKQEKENQDKEYDEKIKEHDEKINIFEQYKEHIEQQKKEKPSINLDNYIDNKTQSDIINIIENYIYSTDSISRQLELTNNLIKHLRSISIKLNQEN